jgi:hypothetical protein
VKRGQTVLIALGISAGLLGCESRSSELLKSQERQVELELAEKTEILQNANEYRQQVEVLEQELTALQAQRFRPTPMDLGLLLDKEPLTKMAVRFEEGTMHLRLDGAGGGPGLVATLRALGRAEQTFVLRQVSVAPTAWAAELELPPEPSTPEEKRTRRDVHTSSARPLPPPGLFESKESEQRRVKILTIQSKIADLDKSFAEMALLLDRRNTLEARLRVLKQLKPQAHLVGQRPVIEALFGGPRPRLTRGMARFQADQLVLSELGEGDEARRLTSLSEVGKVLQANAETIVLRPSRGNNE